MNKKKLLALAIAGVLTVGAVGAGTLAFFTASHEVKNVITMGDVDVDLEEPNFPGGKDGGEIPNITPGASFEKDPTITLKENSEDAYARVQLKVSATKDTANFALTDAEVAELFTGIDVDQTDWFVAGPVKEVKDEVAVSYTYTLYYKDKLSNKEGGVTEVKAFENVTIPSNWGNKFKNVSIVLDVTAEVIQADNFTPVTANGMITSWGNITIE